MAKKPGAKLSLQQQRELFETRETWCAVEQTKEAAWCRKERKHYDELLKSSVFSTSRCFDEPRCVFKVDAPTHKERRHYEKHQGPARSPYPADSKKVIRASDMLMHRYQIVQQTFYPR